MKNFLRKSSRVHKKLRIAQVAPLWYPVPPSGYGGTEQVISHLTEGLVRRGHDVTLFASGDSKTKARLISILKKNAFDLGVPWLHDSYNIANLIESFSSKYRFDIIHTHIDVHDPVIRGLHPETPSVATLHNPFWPMPNDQKKNKRWTTYQGRVLLYNRFPDLPYIAISNSYRKQCPARINFLKTIYHGINPGNLPFNPRGGDYFVWFGRISQAKGAHIAVRIAKTLGIKLLLAGPIVNPEAHAFFKEEIKPYLNRRIQFIGEITSKKELGKFLGGAKAFLYPLRWEEPFGITMIESMACGTPVIALNRGSVMEIVKDKKTGFVVDTLGEFKRAIRSIDAIERNECRTWVETQFTAEKMVGEYELLYHSIIDTWHKTKKR